MRLARHSWVLSPLLAMGGLMLITQAALCVHEMRGYLGYDPVPTSTIRFLGMTLSQNAAGWLAALIGGVLGAALAFVVHRAADRRYRGQHGMRLG
jgi:hypothetical protein